MQDLAYYNVYATADRKYVALAAIEEKFWRTFCERAGRRDLVPLHLDPNAQPQLEKELEEVFRSRTLDGWLQLFADTDVCLTKVNSVGETIEDPHLAARGTVVEHEGAKYLRTPIVFCEVQESESPKLRKSNRCEIQTAPELGAHTDEVLRRAGIDAKKMEWLHANRVI